MPEMSEMPKNRVPAAAAAAASHAERGRRRKAFWERVYLAACVVVAAGLFVLGPRLADNQARSVALGAAVGFLVTVVALILLLVRGRRGHDTMLSREMDGVWDERDRAVKQKMWAVAGRMALPIMIILVVVSFTSLPISSFVRAGVVVYSITVGTARFYYDRTM